MRTLIGCASIPETNSLLEMDSTRTNLEPHVQTAVRSQDISNNLQVKTIFCDSGFYYYL